MPFADHFSANSAHYARHRPTYPDELFAWLATLTPARIHAVDVATGNGQAAVALANHFGQISAFDASAAQISVATAHPHVNYAIAPAENLPLNNHSADLLTVAQALHWFAHDAFYAETRRVLKPDGVIACWTYNLLTVTPEIDALVMSLYRDVLGYFWPAERYHVETDYVHLPFPFVRCAAPHFAMEARWNCDHLLGYLRTWSAWKAFIEAGNPDPVNEIEPALRHAFGPGERRVQWPLTVLVGTP